MRRNSKINHISLSRDRRYSSPRWNLLSTLPRSARCRSPGRSHIPKLPTISTALGHQISNNHKILGIALEVLWLESFVCAICLVLLNGNQSKLVSPWQEVSVYVNVSQYAHPPFSLLMLIGLNILMIFLDV